MIPSTTKLALLSGVLLLAGEIGCHPVLYDQRQEGQTNARADLEDILFVILPSKDLIQSSVNLVNLGVGSLGKSNGKAEKIPLRTASKLGFILPEKSPYKVDLEKSSVPLAKVQPAVQEKTTEGKTVKKELKAEEKGEDSGETLKLIGEGIEECGPDGHRNGQGMCVFPDMEFLSSA